MSDRNLKGKLSIKILEDSTEILKYLQLGISIPIWPEFNKYIRNDLEYFNAKSIILQEDKNPIGNVLLFNDDESIVYFGYIGVLNHDPNKISFLIDRIINYAKNNNYKFIRGPINIPVIIFGWGFMKEGSFESLFSTKPVNPPIYQNKFQEKGFYILHEDYTLARSRLIRFNPWKLKQYDFSDYEYFNPKDMEELFKYKSDLIRIHLENLPPTSRITPNVKGVIDSYFDYVFNFGYKFMIFFVRYKPENKIVACGTCLPNPFRKDAKGNYDSCIIYSSVVEPEHRRKGLGMLMYGETARQMWKKKIKYICGPIPTDNINTIAYAKKLGGIHSRTHLILEYEI
ncbi:MAG: GNAT family N-acetyltransferase [Promethearchaeota archaeon]